MDNRTLTAVLLSLAVWYGWLALFPPPEIEEETSGPEVVAVDETVPGGAATPDGAAVPVASTPEVGVDAPPSDLPVEERAVEVCGVTMQMSTDGARVHSVAIPGQSAPYQTVPVYEALASGALFDGTWLPYGEEPGLAMALGASAMGLSVGAGTLGAKGPVFEVVAATDHAVTMRGRLPSGVTVDRRIYEEGAGDACRIRVEVTWRNTSLDTAYDGALWMGISDVLPEATSRYNAANRPWVYVDEEAVSREDLEALSGPDPEPGRAGWFGLMDSQFAFLAVPDADVEGQGWFNEVATPEGAAHGAYFVMSEGLAPGAQKTSTFSVFAGMKSMPVLEAFDPTLGEAVQLGWFSFFALPLMWGLQGMYSLVGSWGLAILGLTVVIKGLLFPMTQSSFKSMRGMQAIQPQLQAIREEFADNPEELNKRTIALFQESGVNPLGGCLPMFLQMPIWIALYSALLSSVDLYHAKFLYLEDLSVPDPYMVTPALCVALMLAQQRFTPTSPGMDPAQARMMKLMPLAFGIFFFWFPSGLMIYIFTNMLLSILQQWYIHATFTPQKA